MNKSQLVELLSNEANITKSSAGKALDVLLNAITDTLATGEEVTLLGFGTFTVKDRPEREGRNPKTGEPIKIKASKVPSFKPGKLLKETVNNV